MRALPTKSLRVGVIQTNSMDDVEANLAQIRRQLKKLSGRKVDLVCLPENALFLRLKPGSHKGFGFDLSEPFWREFKEWAHHEQCEILVGSVPFKENDGGDAYVSNATIHITAQTVTCVYRKIHLFDVDVKGAPPVRESDQFRPGDKPAVLEIKGWRLGLTICYDLRFGELFVKYAREGVHVLLIPAAFLVPTGKAHWHVLMRARAIESQVFVVAAAQSGIHGTRRTYGHSLVVEPWGQIVRESKKRSADAFIVDLDPQLLAQVQMQIPMADHRRL